MLIEAGELKKAACCNLSESFQTNASVDVNYSDAVTGAKEIKLLGLNGTYVQNLLEGVPFMRGVTATFVFRFLSNADANAAYLVGKVNNYLVYFLCLFF